MKREGFTYYDPKKRAIKRAVIAVIALALIVTSVVLIMKYRKEKAKEQNATEWFLKQGKYLDNLMLYSQNMDNITSLYLSGEIALTDFVVHLRELKGEINLMRADYDGYLKEHPVILGSETAATKIGNEAVVGLMDTYREMVDMLDKYKTDKETLAYNYIAYSQVITDYLSSYIAARYSVYDQLGVKVTPLPYKATDGVAEKSSN